MASCHTHAATKLSSHRSHRTLRNLTICEHLWNLWENILCQKLPWILWILWENPTQPNHLWASVKSVGGSSTLEASVNSVNSVGGLAEGGVGMARCHTLLICEHLWNLWENILRQKFLWIPWIPWEDYNVGARVLGRCTWDKCTPLEGGVGMAGCHTLLQKLPQIARMCTD